MATRTVGLRRLVDVLLPYPCIACGESKAGARRLGLCPGCAGLLAPNPEPACRLCGRSLSIDSAASAAGARLERCGPCTLDPLPWGRLMVGWLYRPPLTAVVHAFKFRRCDFLATELGVLLGRRFTPSIGDGTVVVPVPLAWPRLITRGYNQAGLIAAAVARESGAAVRRLLARRARRPQARLGRRRRQRNVAGAMAVRRGVSSATRVLLVDDVMTTGATLRTAAAVLREAGATSIDVLVGARTPRGDEAAVRPRLSGW